MKILELHEKQLDYTKFIKRTAEEKDYDTLIKEPVIGVLNGEIKFIYDYLDWDTKPIVEAFKHIKYTEGQRARGLFSKSRIFGFRPRLAMRRDYCSSTSLAYDFPNEHALICNLAGRIETIYQKNDPKQYEAHKKITDEKIKKSYRIGGGSVFTSGIINKNNPLKYHYDTGNFKKVFSCMPVFKSGITGGHLALPEFGIGIELKNNSIFMFDGQGIMHGVTPIKYDSPLSYRYSIVYYSLKNIWQCLEIDEEVARIRNVKTKREKMRQNMTPEHEKFLRSRFGKQ